MDVSITIYKEKKEKDFRMIILPSGRSKIGLIQYNNIDLDFFENKYSLVLNKKDGRGYSPFKDENGDIVEYIFPEKPTALELGTKVMEMFEYKERYDGLIE